MNSKMFQFLMVLGLTSLMACGEVTSAAPIFGGDRSAPTVPGSLTATAISTTQIDLSWTASKDNVAVKGYKIFEAGRQIATTTSTNFSRTGLLSNTNYSFNVAAYDAATNTSVKSNTATATTQSTNGGGGSGDGQSTCSGNMNNFKVTGDPTSNGGASWTYVSTEGGISYNLKGILYKPTGNGPFPGVIVSHGKGGTAPAEAAVKFKGWGAVAIGTNYTHSSDTSGSPTGEDGASTANLQRAHKLWDILCGLGYVKMNKMGAHGHSMGAFVTAALVGSYPNDFMVASHTAGGVSDSKSPTWTTSTQAKGIKIPYSAHHGDADTVVPLKDDEALDGILTANLVKHELVVYQNYTHPDVRTDPAVLEAVRDWYEAQGFFDP
jgi:dienelactone hydrolase/chitodextrinase